MLNLVQGETERIEARFLDPACGNGNFLVQILRRKLAAVELKYSKSEFERQRYALLALMCIYGIELLADNIVECRSSMLDIMVEYLKIKEADELYRAASYILLQNIVHGDTLTMCTQSGEPILFYEWGYLGEGKFQRRKFCFDVFTRASTLKAKGSLQFDVIIGNPPYQKSDGGYARSAVPIYHLFIEQTRILAPHYISMIIPARWYAGGRGLDGFRKTMLSDQRIRKLVDFEDSSKLFPEVIISGGVCYFLWDRDHPGLCEVVNSQGEHPYVSYRSLSEFSTFIRNSKALPIVRKVLEAKENNGRTLAEVVSPRTPFRLGTTYSPHLEGIPCWFKQRIGLQFANGKDVYNRANLLQKWKLLIPPAPISGQIDFSKPIGFYHPGNTCIAKPGECCTESWLVACAFDSEEAVISFRSYLFTKIIRFLILQTVVSQHVTRDKFIYVPDLGEYKGLYTDAILGKRWTITDKEWKFIDSKVKSVDLMNV